MKRDPALHSIPVVVLTHTDTRRTIRRCFNLGANAYLIKPIEVEKFVHAVRGCIAFVRACKQLMQSVHCPRARKR